MSKPFDNLRNALTRRTRLHLTRPRRAAVLVPIIDDGGPLRVILTRRTDTVKTHKGQVAFPGGLLEPEDRDEQDAALREAREEIALPPDLVEVVGLLDDIPTVTNKVAVTPVVGRLGELPALTPQPSEVARIFEVPLHPLRDPSVWRVKMYPFEGEEYPVYFHDHDNETLWGLSAYVTLQLLALMGIGEPFDLSTHKRLQM